MDVFGLIYMVSGMLLSVLVLRICNGEWADLWKFAIFAAIPNAITASMVFLLFYRPANDVAKHRVLLVGSYFVGVVIGVYLYFT